MGSVTIDVGFLLALFPVAVAIGGFLAATFYRINPVQRRRDAMINETLTAAEKRVAQLSVEVDNLEAQVQRLREDLAYERGLTRELRQQNEALQNAIVGQASLE